MKTRLHINHYQCVDRTKYGEPRARLYGNGETDWQKSNTYSCHNQWQLCYFHKIVHVTSWGKSLKCVVRKMFTKVTVNDEHCTMYIMKSHANIHCKYIFFLYLENQIELNNQMYGFPLYIVFASQTHLSWVVYRILVLWGQYRVFSWWGRRRRSTSEWLLFKEKWAIFQLQITFEVIMFALY